MIKLIYVKCKSMIFKFIELRNHSHNPVLKYFHHPKVPLCPGTVTLPLPPQAVGNY